ncbi:hypothetical protein EDB84DRAFT_1571993 [Lactarius hengduanensis]|nr:hypothetical protein EDB84DRAFT_1571993 [Lactarius hengduanensis]
MCHKFKKVAQAVAASRDNYYNLFPPHMQDQQYTVQKVAQAVAASRDNYYNLFPPHTQDQQYTVQKVSALLDKKTGVWMNNRVNLNSIPNYFEHPTIEEVLTHTIFARSQSIGCRHLDKFSSVRIPTLALALCAILITHQRTIVPIWLPANRNASCSEPPNLRTSHTLIPTPSNPPSLPYLSPNLVRRRNIPTPSRLHRLTTLQLTYPYPTNVHECRTTMTPSLPIPRYRAPHSSRPGSTGRITPKAIRDFENHAENFFLNVKGGVEEEEKVTKIIGCFESSLVHDWIAINRKTLCALSFEKFMKTFRKRWLPANWEEDLLNQVLGTELEPKRERFETWATEIQTLNVGLRGTASHISDEQMRKTLDANIDIELRRLGRKQKTALITDLDEWMRKLTEIDDERQFDRKRLADAVVEEVGRVTKKPYNPARSSAAHTAPSNNASASANTSNKTNTFPPKLTEEERRLLFDHEGCLKCRKFYAGHRAGNCTVTLSGKNYKTLTLQDALRAKPAKSVPRNVPVAATADASDQSDSSIVQPTDLVAALFPPNAISIGENSLSETDSSMNSVSGPQKEEHFIWKCTVNGSTADLSVNTRALIDSGAHMVFIRPELVSRLKLQTIPLAKPEHVSVAWTRKAANVLSHYVLLAWPHAMDCSVLVPCTRSSHPKLCMPIILGLPFLTRNEITGVSKSQSAPVEQPDVLASIRERINTLSIEETYAAKMQNCGRNSRRFSNQPPHVDELPTSHARTQTKRLEHPGKVAKLSMPAEMEGVLARAPTAAP